LSYIEKWLELVFFLKINFFCVELTKIDCACGVFAMRHKKIVIVLFLVISYHSVRSNLSCSVDTMARFIRTRSYKNNNNLVQKYFNKLGNHIIAEFMGCHNNLANLNNIEKLENVLRQAAQAAGATVLAIKGHAFPPMPWVGMTCVAVLQESHISVHTWPQYGYVAIDVFTCGEHVDIEKALAILQQFFEPKDVSLVKLDRGFIHEQ